MIPPEMVEALNGISLFESSIVVIAAITAVWAAGKFLVWLFKRFFPGVIASANAVINGAKIFASVNGLPDFISRTDATLETLSTTGAEHGATLAEHGKTLAAQDERIAEIHKETQTNGGSTLRDVVVRVEKTVTAEVLPALKALTGDNKVLHADNAKLRKDFEETQASEIHLTVTPKATVTEES